MTFSLAQNMPHYNRSRLFSMSYTQVKLRKSRSRDKSKNEIFEAINQVVKYVSYEIESYLDGYRKGQIQTTSCAFFLPLIVFDGRLYRANITETGISLKRAKHVVLTTYYKPRYETHRVPFWIDIVTRTYFATYLSMIEKEIDSLNKQLEKHKDISKIFLKSLQLASKSSQ